MNCQTLNRKTIGSCVYLGKNTKSRSHLLAKEGWHLHFHKCIAIFFFRVIYMNCMMSMTFTMWSALYVVLLFSAFILCSFWGFYANDKARLFKCLAAIRNCLFVTVRLIAMTRCFSLFTWRQSFSYHRKLQVHLYALHFQSFSVVYAIIIK